MRPRAPAPSWRGRWSSRATTRRRTASCGASSRPSSACGGVANQTTAALAAQIRALDEQILDNEQRIAFYRQLLAERGSDASAVAIRSFEIVPDYREDSHQLVVVLSQPADSESFVGSLDLVLSLRSAERGEFEFRPAFAAGLLQVNFRYYIEFKEIFQLPPGAEIVNGQLVLRDAENEVVTSQILREQAF